MKCAELKVDSDLSWYLDLIWQDDMGKQRVFGTF